MTSPKKLAANRLNARQSRGPQTPEGKKRSSRNAHKHGMTTPLELSWQAVHVPEITAMLEAQGHGWQQALDFAKCIVDFERNEQHQRELMAFKGGGWLPKLDPQWAVQHYLREHREIERVGNLLSRHWPPADQKAHLFLKDFNERLIKRDTQAAARQLDCSERHHRRAANQLLKSLRRLVA